MDNKSRLSKDRPRRSTSRRLVPTSNKLNKARPSSTTTSTTQLNGANNNSSRSLNSLPLEPKPTPALYAPLIPNAADILQVGSPLAESLLMQRTSNMISAQSGNEKEIQNSNSTGMASSPLKEVGGGQNGHSVRRHHLDNSLNRESSLDSSSGSNKGSTSDATFTKHSKDGSSTISHRMQPSKHAFLPWRTSTATNQSGQEDSDDEEFVYPENHVDPRRRSGYCGIYHTYSAGTLKSGNMYLQVPDSPFANSNHHNVTRSGSSQNLPNLAQLPYNAYPADSHMYRYSTNNDTYTKRPSPEGYATIGFGYGSTSSAAYNNSPHHHYSLHPHTQPSPIPHTSSYYNEFPIPENIDPERVRLLGKPPHHHHPNPSDLYWGDLRDIRHQHSSRKRIFSSKPAPALILTVLLIVLTGFPLVFLCIRPLADTSIVRVHAINATSDIYEFDVIFGGSNPNIVPIKIKDVDLDILVAAHLPNTRYGRLQHDEDDDDNEDSNYRVSSYSKNGDNDERPATEELLGHIKSLDTPLSFPSWITTNATGHVAMQDPSNTLGKLIYMLGTYTLQLRGTLTYHTVFVLPYTVPVCTMHYVEHGKVKKYEPCGASDDTDDSNGEDGNDSGYQWWEWS